MPPIQAIQRTDATYPARLQNIADPPETLYIRGTLPPDDRPTVAIVGTRKATLDGRTAARELARELAARGVVIISGLALGIDAAAHEGALDTRSTEQSFGRAKSFTVAVLGGGPDIIYPPSHESLGRRIEVQGAILAEYPPGTPCYPNQFLARNRIVSGLADAVVIVEAPITSGALATARHAANQGREVFVLPGPAGHPHYAGSHMLIREGARLIRNGKDLMEDMPSLAEISALTPTSSNDDPILATLAGAPHGLSVDKIAEATTLEPQMVLTRLTMLTLEGIVQEKNGKFKMSNF